MSKNEIKKVSNLTLKIEKAQEIIETKNFDLIRQNLLLFKTLNSDVERQMMKFVKSPGHELDFPRSYLSELSNTILNFIKNDQNNFTFEKYIKYFEKYQTVDANIFENFVKKTSDELLVDTVLRETYKSLGYYALVYELWENSSDKKPFDKQITDLLRSFL